MKTIAFGSPRMKIRIPQSTINQWQYLLDKMGSTEVQWFSTVDRTVIEEEVATNKPGYKSMRRPQPTVCYNVDGIIIPKQVVHGTETDADPARDPDSMMVILRELRERYKILDDNGEYAGCDRDAINNVINRMHCWSHTHPFGHSSKPSPSGTDNSNFVDWVNDNNRLGITTPMVMMIFGKKIGAHNIFTRVYDPEWPNCYYEDVPVELVAAPMDTTYIDEALKDKIKRAAPVRKVVGVPKVQGSTTTKKGASAGAPNPPKSVETPSASGPQGGQTQDSSSDNQELKKKYNTILEQATRTFAKRWNHPLSFEDFLCEVNSRKDNEQLVVQFCELLTTWLKTNSEWWYFTRALMMPWECIDKMVKNPVPPFGWDFEEKAKTMMVDHYSTAIVDIPDVSLCVRFARRFENATSELERKKTIQFFYERQTALEHMANLALGPSPAEMSDEQWEELIALQEVESD